MVSGARVKEPAMNVGIANMESCLALVITLLLSACSHKDIECPFAADREVHVNFMWDNAPGASPEGMTVYFFPESKGGAIWRFDIAGASGGPVQLPVGSYRMLACNNDLRGVRLVDTNDFGTVAAQARTSADDIAVTSGMLYGATVPHVEVTLCGVIYTSASGEHKECGKSVIRCSPDSLATEFRVIVKNVNGIERVKSAEALVRSVNTRMVVSSAMPSGAEAALSVPMEVDRAQATMEGDACGFLPVGSRQYWLTVRIARSDGKMFTKDIDITDRVNNLNGRRRVIIIIDGIDIPEGDIPSNPDDVGGIAVGVDGWNVVEIDLESNCV